MGGLECSARLIEDLRHFVRATGSAVLDDTLEVVAREQLHHDIDRPSLQVSTVEDGDDVGVVDFRDGPRFGGEAAPNALVVELRRIDDLDRHVAIEPLVEGLVHGAHPPFAEEAKEAIATRNVMGQGPGGIEGRIVVGAALGVLIEAATAFGADLQEIEASIEEVLTGRLAVVLGRGEVVAQPLELQCGTELPGEAADQPPVDGAVRQVSSRNDEQGEELTGPS